MFVNVYAPFHLVLFKVKGKESGMEGNKMESSDGLINYVIQK